MMLAQTIWLPEQVSTLAGEIDTLFYFILWTSVLIFAGVVLTMLYFVYKYRRRSPADRTELVVPSKLIEVSWIVVPTILVLIIFNWGFQGFIRLNVAPADAYHINVTGKKWLWEFEYPNGARTVGELHVPADRPVRLQMSSEDVIHSFFIPAFRVKMDVLPNRYTSVWFEATQEGEYQVFCTEYCGTQHSTMLAKVIVHSREGFNEWLQTGGGLDDLPLVELGERLHAQLACGACHSLDGTSGVGPTFQGLYMSQRQFTNGTSAQADENYLRESILQPSALIVQGYQNVMPPSYGGLSERELNALIEFIRAQ
jgi:cytochrome c oxidase subunit II